MTIAALTQAEGLQEQLDEVTRELQLGKKGVDAAENALQVSIPLACLLRSGLHGIVKSRTFWTLCTVWS